VSVFVPVETRVSRVENLHSFAFGEQGQGESSAWSC
jgi:hypothetical protein